VTNRGAGFGATTLAFDVKITRQAREQAERNDVDIIQGTVIYTIFEEFKRRKRNFLAQVLP
jgi:translation initiation factor IF-2